MTTATQDRPVLARFTELVSYQSQHADNGIPREVMEYLAANKVFPVVCPPGLVGRNALAPLRGWPGLCITIAQCTPNQGPVSHNHTGTLETFFCLDGRFDVLWGNQLQHKVTLEPGDLCSVPPNVYRTFRNLTDSEARLLVMIQGDEKMSDKIEMPRRIGGEIRDKHGDKVMELLAGINMRFQGDDAQEVSPEAMQQRISRAAQLKAQAAGGETVYPVMASRAGQAPVQAWPGFDVAMLQPQAGESSTGSVDGEHIQWVINIGEAPCEVASGSQKVTLGRYDMVRVEPGMQRTVRNVGDKPARVLLATQGKETISPNGALH
jgi:mannose-6-phosphate isomerase-like protein (cupin superfamily)